MSSLNMGISHMYVKFECGHVAYVCQVWMWACRMRMSSLNVGMSHAYVNTFECGHVAYVCQVWMWACRMRKSIRLSVGMQQMLWFCIWYRKLAFIEYNTWSENFIRIHYLRVYFTYTYILHMFTHSHCVYLPADGVHLQSPAVCALRRKVLDVCLWYQNLGPWYSLYVCMYVCMYIYTYVYNSGSKQIHLGIRLWYIYIYIGQI